MPRLRQMAEEAGRDPASLSVTFGGAPGGRQKEWDRKFADSPLEQAGFEFAVPLERCAQVSSQRKRSAREPGRKAHRAYGIGAVPPSELEN